MKKLLVAFSLITSVAALTTLPALADGNPTFRELAKEYRHSFKSSFHDAKKSSCVEVYETGHSNKTDFEFSRKGFTFTAAEVGQADTDAKIKYTFTPNFWRTGYIAKGERNGTSFRLHARETLTGNFIIKMTMMDLGLMERPIGYIKCTIEK
ncbi:MAG: hypothetical protein ABIQ95_13070 [Bdellovibrionia bacterium]